jgi:UDP-2,4-diacetamido-2,4,6-trideoxy-beta-L-altropyranose hydrolase
MTVVFRADASLHIGTGHVMRDLTLAQALSDHGVTSHFICREHQGHLIEMIRAQGHVAHALPVLAHPARSDGEAAAHGPDLAHGHWLGATQAADAQACQPILASLRPDWLVVDHYALDERWEVALAPLCDAVMVVDDLADRRHACQVLLDQTFSRAATDYRDKVNGDCETLCGAEYALLRPGFAALREQSLQRRNPPVFQELLVSMGGVDQANATGEVLRALCASGLPAECRITVVMGQTAPWLAQVQAQALDMPWPTQVLVGVSDMARLMCDSDVAIGAAGATSWERCCLGLPTAMVVLADNQRHAARLLEQAQAVRMLEAGPMLSEGIARFITDTSHDLCQLAELGRKASLVTDGRGCERVVARLMSKVLS